MSDYAPAAYLAAIFERLKPCPVDFEVSPFDGMSREQQDEETRHIGKQDFDAAWEAFEQCVSHEAFVKAWRERDAFEMLRLMDVAARDGLRDDINETHKRETEL